MERSMDEEDFSSYLGLINNCDASEQLLSQSRLGDRLNQIPLECVHTSDLNSLTMALSVEQLIPTEGGLARDYRGMAELMGYSSAEIETRFKKSNNSAKSLIDAFIYRSIDCQDRNNHPSVNDLLKIIEKIERFDVIDDFLPTLIDLASQNISNNQIANAEIHHDNLNSHEPHLRNVDRLTFDDTTESATKYDAFICYAPQDFNEAHNLKSELQNRGKRVATASDLLPGHFEHDALMRLIDLRCRKVVLIVTRNFCNSEECKFQLKFASEVAIKGNDLKIIPVLYEKIPNELIPGMIRYTSKINLNDPIAGRAIEFNRLILSIDYSPYPPSKPHGQQESRLIQLNRRTSSFNGQITIKPVGPGRNHADEHFEHSFSNGNSPLLNRATNEPIVELSYSQDSRAIGRSSPQESTFLSTGTNCGLTEAIRSSEDDSAGAGTRKWLITKIKSTFSARKKTIDRDLSSFASQSLLISTNSSHLSTDENIQSHKMSE